MRRFIATICFIFIGAYSALASGFSIYEASIRANGMLGAFSAYADHVTTIYYNPAGLSGLEGIQISAGATVIAPRTSFRNLSPLASAGEKFNMKRAFALILTVVILLSACSKAPEPPFEKGSEEYTFFRGLADTVGLTVFDPDVNKKLISTSEFNVYTSDIMPALYGGLASFDGKWDQIPVPQVKEFAKQNATGLAEKKLFYAKATDEGYGVADSIVNDQMEQIYKNRGED